jgi:hypothetical protein
VIVIQPLQCFQWIVERIDADIFFGLLNNLGQYRSAGGFVIDDQYFSLTPENAESPSVFVRFDIRVLWNIGFLTYVAYFNLLLEPGLNCQFVYIGK